MLVAMFSAQIGLSTLAQTDILPESVMNILLQLPVVAILAYMVSYFLKWHDVRMDKVNKWHAEQMISLLETLNELAGAVGELDKQLAINTGTVNESIRVHELAEDIKNILLKNMEEKND